MTSSQNGAIAVIYMQTRTATEELDYDETI